MKAIIINGPAANGKSSFIKFCKEFYQDTYELSMVDFVKEVANYIGWNGEKTEKSRKFLADLKDAISKYDKNIIYNSIQTDIDLLTSNSNSEPIFFINARSPEDINYLVKKYDAKTLLISNPNITQVTSNHADKNVFCYQYDYIINNNKGLRELRQKAKSFIESRD